MNSCDRSSQMLPPPAPVTKRSLLQRASSKLSNSSNRLSFVSKWKSSSWADLTSSSKNKDKACSSTHQPNFSTLQRTHHLPRSSSTEFRCPTSANIPFNSNLRHTASIRRKSLRSSWRDLAKDCDTTDQQQNNSSSSLNNRGVNRGVGGCGGGSNRLSHVVLKAVTPPVVPGQEKRNTGGSASFFGGPRNSSTELRLKSDASFRLLHEDSSTEMPLSPGRDSIGHDSTASCLTTESTSSGCRTSMTSTDSSGRHNNINNSRNNNNLHRSIHSSSSSIVSGERGEDVICPVSVRALMESGLPDPEVLNAWLTDQNFEEYCHLFINAGYDMPTISRMTPEDLTAIGIQKPNHRKRLKSEISKLDIGDGLPNYIPGHLEEWLYLIRLPEYGHSLRIQGYNSIEDVIQISVEDLEDVGILKLGHQKRFLLAAKKVKDLRSGKLQPQQQQQQFHSMSENHYAAAGGNLKLVPHQQQQQQQQQSISSFRQLQQQQQLQSSPAHSRNLNHASNNNNHHVVIEAHHHQQPAQRLYQPEVIQISNPSQHQQHHHQQHLQHQQHQQNQQLNNSFPTPPSPTTLSLHNVPQPMQQFNSLTRSRYLPGLGGGKSNRTFNPNFQGQNNTTTTMRSFDDSHFVQGPPQPPLRSDMTAISGGGTLPRPRGLVKPMPIAKAAINNSEGDLQNDFDLLKNNLKLNFSQNDINQHSPEEKVHVGKRECISTSGSPTKEKSKKGSAPPGASRSAGDVLNDIGSMLADLTDELDAMLHSDRDSNQVC